MLELEVGSPAHGGTCVARTDGRVVFCRGALPGETVAVELSESGEKQRFWRAETAEVLATPNPGRVQSPCRWYRAEGCGGCAWLHADQPTQNHIKAEVLAETLRRLGGIDLSPEVHDLGLTAHWRTRMTLHTDADGRAGLHAHRSRDVIAIGDCLQADERLELEEVLGRSWPAGSDVHVSVSEAGRAVVWRQDGQRMFEGPPAHRHEVHGRTFVAAVDGFWQSHKLAASYLSDLVAEWVGQRRGAKIVDLYAGVGLFGLTLADRVEPAGVLLVEGDRTAARFARRNTDRDPRIWIRGVDVRRWAVEPESADLVILDPPRAGAGPRVVQAIVATGADTVVYVSCEPSTLARDLAEFRDYGFAVDRLVGADLFPGTAHVETIVRLVR